MNKLNGKITKSATLRGVMTRGAGGGTYVEANPEGEATGTLEKLMVEDTIYSIRNVPDATSAHNGNVLTKTTNGVMWVPLPETGIKYSTNEQEIGTWLDGSKVYQRVFTGLNIQTNGTNWVHVPSIDTSTWGEIISCNVYRTVRDKMALLPIAEVSPNIDNIKDLSFTLVSSTFDSIVTTIIATYTKAGE